MTDQTGLRRWICVECQSRIILEEACFSGILPDETTTCDVCGAIGSFEHMAETQTTVKRFSATIFGEGYIGGAQFETLAEAINACRHYDFANRFIVYDNDEPAHEEVKDGWRIVK